MRERRILVTGASGFVGRAVVTEGARRGLRMRAATRRLIPWPAGIEPFALNGGIETADWSDALREVDVVVHCAARVHVMDERSADPSHEYRETNVIGTTRLAQHAAKMGVRRLVFLSTIKVNGEKTCSGRPFTAHDVPMPADPYGISKWEAEQSLATLAARTGLEVTVVRPPLVYGPGVKANFLALMRWVCQGRPLPFGAVRNQRSFIALGNLVDLLLVCTTHPSATGTFLAGDGQDVSTAELCRKIGEIAGRPARLFSLPPAMLQSCAALVGKREVLQRLCGWLQVDTRETCARLGWRPPLRMDDGLRLALHDLV